MGGPGVRGLDSFSQNLTDPWVIDSLRVQRLAFLSQLFQGFFLLFRLLKKALPAIDPKRSRQVKSLGREILHPRTDLLKEVLPGAVPDQGSENPLDGGRRSEKIGEGKLQIRRHQSRPGLFYSSLQAVHRA